MKKLIVSLLFVIALGASYNAFAAKAKKATKQQETTQRQLDEPEVSAAQEMACRIIMEALHERYDALDFEKMTLREIQDALQEVVDENRETFDIAKQIMGGQLPEAYEELPAGTWVFPVPLQIILK